MSESVIYCEGYHDRAFWAGWLTHLGCADPGVPSAGSSMRRPIYDPWYTKVQSGQFAYHSAIDLPRPVQPEAVTEHLVGSHKIDAAFVDGNEAKIGRHWGGNLKGLADAHVISHSFEAFEEIDTKQPHSAHQKDDAEGDQSGNAFDRFKLHCEEQNKKTRATQGCPGF